jgi:hypothetical protein
LDITLGNTFNFEEDFETGEEDGVIIIGDIVIDTAGEEDDEDDDY